MPYRREQTPFQKAMYGLLTQGIPAYVAYKTEQKAEKEKKKETDRKIKEARKIAELNIYEAFLKDADPTVRGMVMGKIEGILGTTPYSVVAGREKLGLPNMPQKYVPQEEGMPRRGLLRPGSMPMGPRLGGVMTTRQPALSEVISGAEPTSEQKYPHTRLQVREHEKFKRGLIPVKGPTISERKLGMDAVSVAALIRQGIKTEKTTFGEKRFSLTGKEDAINFAGEMGWTADTPEYQQHIAPAIEQWWTRYQPQQIAELQGNAQVKNAVWRRLKQLQRDGYIRKDVKMSREDDVLQYIERNLEEVGGEWEEW